MADQRYRRRLTARRKTAVVLELLRTRASPKAICSKYGIASSDLASWVYLFIEAGQRALEEAEVAAPVRQRRRAAGRVAAFPRIQRD
jgi:transposase-like protein